MNVVGIVEVVNQVALPAGLGFFGLWMSGIFKPH